jgi:hypothetical protein
MPFEITEIPFDPDQFETTLEDEFLLTKVTKELEAVTNIETLRTGAIKLLQLAVHRQAVIRGLVKRIASIEGDVIKRYYEE